jgi:peptide chain release factor subunit 1
MSYQTVVPAADPRIVTELSPLIERLAAITPGRHPVLSCYLRLGPRDRNRLRYLTEIRNRARALSQDPLYLGLDSEKRAEVERMIERLMDYLATPARLPHARGLALFACESLGLFAAVPLPRVHQTRLLLDDTPWIAELVALEDEFEPVLVALIDRAHARFFETTPMAGSELAGLVEPAGRGGRFRPDRRDAPGWGERDYHGRLAAERHRHYAAVGRRIEELARRRVIRGIVLAGPVKETAALSRFLPGRLADRLLGTVRLNPTSATIADVRQAAMAAAEEHDDRAVARELEELREMLGTGWAVDGPIETLRALHRGQVRTLLVREGLEGLAYRCAASARLVRSPGECRGEGGARPVRALADEAIEQALRLRARVIVVPGDAAGAFDGLAATLRFR